MIAYRSCYLVHRNYVNMFIKNMHSSRLQAFDSYSKPILIYKSAKAAG